MMGKFTGTLLFDGKNHGFQSIDTVNDSDISLTMLAADLGIWWEMESQIK